jgi:peptide/nickel transport system permease protein
MLISITVGTTVGLLAGFYRWLDGILMRLTDLFLALPLLPLLLVIIMLFRDTLRAAFGPQTGIFILIVTVIGLTSWMNTARIVRGEVLAVREREFVTAASALGSVNNRIIFLHILPNVLSPILVSATLGVASAIITESALSFLGLGFPSDVPTWGRLLFDGRDYINITPTRVVWPGTLISLIVLSVNFMGDGLRDALDPKLRGRS